MREWFAIAASAVALALAAAPASARTPAWLALVPGQIARVGAAPWSTAGRPEAALTSSRETASIAAEDYLGRPFDAVGEPIGVRVVIAHIYGKVALVRPLGQSRTAYARVDRLVPEVPRGVGLVVAGGFGNYADFYAARGVPESRARQIATGTPLVALGLSVAPYDPEGSDFVRVKVAIRGGAFKGQTGWIPVGYTGIRIPGAAPASTAERQCRCRIVEFR